MNEFVSLFASQRSNPELNFESTSIKRPASRRSTNRPSESSFQSSSITGADVNELVCECTYYMRET